MAKTNLKLSVIILLFCMSCTNNEQLLRYSLAESKENSSELKKVLLHYQKEDKDPLKEKAARFLIENMNDKYSYSGTLMNAYDEIFDSIKLNTNKIGWDGYSPLAGNYMDKVLEKYPNASLDVKMDLQTITAKQLIDNIDLSFYSWKRAPWAKYYSFEQFCEYVLPYRCMDEPINAWRIRLMSKNDWLLDSLKNGSVIKAVKLINKSLFCYVNPNNNFNRVPFSMGYFAINNTNRGRCIEQCNFTIMNMRALGIPVSMDFTPVWAKRSSGHSWNALIDTTGKTIDFFGTMLQPFEHSLTEAPSKIYRRTFSIQRSTPFFNIRKLEPIPDFFQKYDFIDVTKQYNMPVANVQIQFRNKKIDRTLAYLCTFNNITWIPIACALIDHDNLLFENMGCGLIPNQIYSKNNQKEGIVYLPVIMINENNYEPLNYPFILYSTKKIHKLIPDKKRKITIILNRKYPLTPRMKDITNKMIGGYFEGSINVNFKKSHLLARIDTLTSTHLQTLKIKNTSKYKFVRYVSPPKSSGNVSEIKFYNEHGEELSGKIFSSPAREDYVNAEKAFDNNLETYYEGKTMDSAYVGLELNTYEKISRIAFSPRSDNNDICIGDHYELFFFDLNGWVSLGNKKANSYELKYENVPSKALYWLRNLSRGKEERIFTIENGKQVWW